MVDVPDDLRERMLPPLKHYKCWPENVVKHNSISSARPMKINIGVEGTFLVVSNLVQLKQNVTSSGIGLQNLSNRCKLIMGKEIEICSKLGVFTVKIPFADE